MKGQLGHMEELTRQMELIELWYKKGWITGVERQDFKERIIKEMLEVVKEKDIERSAGSVIYVQRR